MASGVDKSLGLGAIRVTSFIGWRLSPTDPDECGFLSSDHTEPCTERAAYHFALKALGSAVQPTGKTCADHALKLRDWPSLERMWSV